MLIAFLGVKYSSLFFIIIEYRNINLLPIDYAVKPHLRFWLTLFGRTFKRKPWIFGALDSHQCFRYSSQHSHFGNFHTHFRLYFTRYRTLSYRALLIRAHNFGRLLSPVHCRRKSAWPVSCYALFKGWRPLGIPPGCLSIFTSLIT